MLGRESPESNAQWSDGDQGMLLTCRIIADIVAKRLPGLRTQTYFRLPRGTVAFVSGPLRTLEFRANGDGSYTTRSTVVAGTGGLGLAMLAGSLAGSAIGNGRARARAMADAQVSFRHQFDAIVYVTNAGFVFQSRDGVYTWDWSSIDAMQMVGPHDALMQGRSDRGHLTWRLLTPWAELIMVLWALDQHPSHPQLADGSWLTPGWLDRARSFGFDPGLHSAVIGGSVDSVRLPGQGELPR